ncbi:MAG: hypothetical protein ABIM74_00890 [candidate division WOR-3 bacterium]
MFIALSLVGVPGICGTAQIAEEFDEKGPKARPTCQTYITTTHFKIHYDTTGTHAVPKSYADSIAMYAEHGWSVYVTQLGFEKPPSDGSMGGDSLYDMYVQYLTGGVLGYTAPESPGGNYPQSYTSYIVIGKNLNASVLRATVVHEFMHACEMAYERSLGTQANIWFMENCAMWGEEMCYPNDNEYVGYLNGVSPLKRPNYEINHMTNPTDLYEYGGVVWALFLMLWVKDTAIIEMIWHRYGVNVGAHSYSDIDYVLSTYYGTDLKTALENYALWRWFVGGRADNWHWSEANLYPPATVVKYHGSYPASGNQGIFYPRGAGGCDYVVFYNYNPNDTLYFYFDGSDGYDWELFVIGYRTGAANPSDTMRIPVDDITGYGTSKIPTADYDSLILVPVVCNWIDGSYTQDLYFEYTVDVVAADESVPDKFLRVASAGRDFLFNLPRGGEVSLRLYDATGRKAFDLVGEFPSGENRLSLPGSIARGVYFWEFSFAGQSRQGKAVIR